MKALFTFNDLAADCKIEQHCYDLNNRNGVKKLGLRIHVPPALFDCHPYSASAYTFMQQLRELIFEFGIVEFPNLPVNKSNYTLAQRAPEQHLYSDNTYLTDHCQLPHQDIPPYPSGFWLEKPRQFSATWIMSDIAAQQFNDFSKSNSSITINEMHKQFIAQSMETKQSVLRNREPGLLLLDNSPRQSLFHARTCIFEAWEKMTRNNDTEIADSPMYAFNEPGLLQHIDFLDSRRGMEFRNQREQESVRQFIAKEQLTKLIEQRYSI